MNAEKSFEVNVEINERFIGGGGNVIEQNFAEQRAIVYPIPCESNEIRSRFCKNKLHSRRPDWFDQARKRAIFKQPYVYVCTLFVSINELTKLKTRADGWIKRNDNTYQWIHMWTKEPYTLTRVVPVGYVERRTNWNSSSRRFVLEHLCSFYALRYAH